MKVQLFRSAKGSSHLSGRMRILCAQVGLLLLWTLCAWGWTGKKCIIFDESEERPVHWKRMGKNCSAQCYKITDVKEDLAEVPSHLQSIGIFMKLEVFSLLPQNSFSRFDNLEYLYIFGCLTQIFYGTFYGLTNLQYLTLESCKSDTCFNTSIEPYVFSHLPKLKELYLHGYAISAIAPDVFYEIPLIEKLYIQDNCIKDLPMLLCKIINMTSLKELIIVANNIKVLKYRNCSSSDGALGKPPTFYDLQNVRLILGTVKLLDNGALKYFKDLSYLKIVSYNTLPKNLTLSGIRKISGLCYRGFKATNLESICELVKIFSIESISVEYDTISNYSVSNIKKCSGLKYMSLWKEPVKYKRKTEDRKNIKFDFIHILQNLSELLVNGHEFKTFGLNSLCRSNLNMVTWLISLTLSENFIETILAKQFYCLVNLEYLDLSNNFITSIEEFTFEGLVHLQILRLEKNKISVIKVHNFFELISLTSLTLEENLLVHIEEMSFKMQTSLRELSLGDLNFFTTESMITLNLTSIFSIIPSNLSDLSISSGMRPMHLIIGSDSTPKPGLTLNLMGQSVSFEDCERPFFKSVVKLNVKAEQFLCGSHFMGKYFKLMEDFEYRSSLKANLVDLSELNQLVKLRRLRLISVDLSKQPLLQIMFHNLTNLEVLILDNCRLHSLEDALTKDFISLKTFIMTFVNPFNVNANFTASLRNLKHIFFFNAKFYCDCKNAWILEWEQDRFVEVTSDPVFEEMSCQSERGMFNFVKYVKASCSFDVGYLLFLSTTVGLLVFMLVVLLYNFAGSYLLAFFHITCGWLAEATHRKGRRHFQFDAFVSYSGMDERWVTEELLPNLEERGPPFLRLCLHSRDFQLGKDILDNITDSLYSSRRTLCLVSRHYLHSNWCSLELRLATHRLLAERRDVLILVFLEKIPPFQLSAHHRLARLVKTRTYLDWPQDQNQRLAFWDRLSAKLAPVDGGI